MSFDLNDFFESIKVIVDGRLNDLSYDTTIVATITDDSDKERGHYIVSDGTITFDAYVNDIRGSLVPYEETAPGPLVKTQEEVVYWLKNLKELEQEFQQTKATFIEKYMPLEDGKASERFVDEVFLAW